MDVCPSGRQFQISCRDQQATIVEADGGIRKYAVGRRPVLDPYPSGATCDGAHGAPLIPWPNRPADGRYRFDGVDYQVALTEPEKHNAIHGFLRWRPWQAVLQAQIRMKTATRLFLIEGFAAELGKPPGPYERLLHDALTGDCSLFTREDAVGGELARPAAAGGPPPAPVSYRRGSWGPPQADALVRGHPPWQTPCLPVQRKDGS